METSRRRWAAGEGGGSGGGTGRRRRRAAGGEPASAALEPLRSRASGGGNPEGQSPRPGRQALSPPAATEQEEGSRPLGPGLAQRGPRAPPCPGLGAQTGPGRHLGGDSRKRLSGDCGRRPLLPSYRQDPAASPGTNGPGGTQPASPEALCRSWVLPIRTVPVTGPLRFRPFLHPCHRSLPEKCPFPRRVGPRGQSFQEPVVLLLPRLRGVAVGMGEGGCPPPPFGAVPGPGHQEPAGPPPTPTPAWPPCGLRAWA